MRIGRKAKTSQSSGAEVCTIDESHLESPGMTVPELEECSQIFQVLRSDPMQLLRADKRNAFMQKIGNLKDKLNKKQIMLQEALVKTLNVKKGPIGSCVGPKVSLKEVEVPFSFLPAQYNEIAEMKTILEPLKRAGCSVRKIQDDGNSLLRAMAFGLLEKGVDMRPHFLTKEFLSLPIRAQRILKESFDRIRKNSTIIQLEMEMNIQEISNAWVSFLHLLTVSQGKNYGQDQKNALKGASKTKGHRKAVNEKESVFSDRLGFANMQSGLPNEAFSLDLLSKQFNVPVHVIKAHCQMPKLEKNAILLLQTSHQTNLLYP